MEGLFVNLDIALLFIAASIFVNIYSKTGAIDVVTRKIVSRVSNKWILLAIMGVMMIIPGALTGAGSISIFVLGSMVTTVVSAMGLSKKKTAAFVFMFAIMSAAAPPVNLWAMMIASGCDIPYVGFDVPLLAPLAVCALFTIIFLGWGSKPKLLKEEILAQLPEAPKMSAWRIVTPLVVLIALFLASNHLAHPHPGARSAADVHHLRDCGRAVQPEEDGLQGLPEDHQRHLRADFPADCDRAERRHAAKRDVRDGCKGSDRHHVYHHAGLPDCNATVLFVAPVLQGALDYGSAVVFGAPLIFMFNSMGYDPKIAAIALSLMFPIGDCLPPSRITGRLVD